MDNNLIITKRIYPSLRDQGLRQQREKFYLDEAGHRGFSVDVGSSRGEVLIRVQQDGKQIARIPILREDQVPDALIEVAALVSAAKAQWRDVGTTEEGFELV